MKVHNEHEPNKKFFIGGAMREFPGLINEEYWGTLFRYTIVGFRIPEKDEYFIKDYTKFQPRAAYCSGTMTTERLVIKRVFSNCGGCQEKKELDEMSLQELRETQAKIETELRKREKEQEEALAILKSFNQLKNDRDVYLYGIIEWGLGESRVKPEPQDFGLGE